MSGERKHPGGQRPERPRDPRGSAGCGGGAFCMIAAAGAQDRRRILRDRPGGHGGVVLYLPVPYPAAPGPCFVAGRRGPAESRANARVATGASEIVFPVRTGPKGAEKGPKRAENRGFLVQDRARLCAGPQIGAPESCGMIPAHGACDPPRAVEPPAGITKDGPRQIGAVCGSLGARSRAPTGGAAQHPACPGPGTETSAPGPTGGAGEPSGIGPAAAGWPMVWWWRARLPDRKDQPCRVLARGAMNSVLVEFPDGFRVVTSRWAVRRRKEG